MQKLLITGQMRSGTTFLANFLNSQNNITVYSDFLRSLYLGGEKMKINDINAKLPDREKNVFISNLKAEAMSFNITGFNSLKNNTGSFNTAIGSQSLLQNMTGRDNVNSLIVGIKKTEEHFYLQQLLNNNYKIIYIIRDPRDIFISMNNRFPEFSLFDSIDRWRKNISTIMGYDGQENFLLVKFESLISQKEKTSLLLSKFLNIKVNPNLKSLTIRKGIDYQDNSSFQDITKLFDSAALYRWKKSLKSPEVVLPSIILKEYLDLFEYDSFTPNKANYKKVLSEYKKYRIKRKIKNQLRQILNKF